MNSNKGDEHLEPSQPINLVQSVPFVSQVMRPTEPPPHYLLRSESPNVHNISDVTCSTSAHQLDGHNYNTSYMHGDKTSFDIDIPNSYVEFSTFKNDSSTDSNDSDIKANTQREDDEDADGDYQNIDSSIDSFLSLIKCSESSHSDLINRRPLSYGPLIRSTEVSYIITNWDGLREQEVKRCRWEKGDPLTPSQCKSVGDSYGKHKITVVQGKHTLIHKMSKPKIKLVLCEEGVYQVCKDFECATLMGKTWPDVVGKMIEAGLGPVGWMSWVPNQGQKKQMRVEWRRV